MESRLFFELIGNEELKKTLSCRLPQACIIDGGRGTGRFTAALYAAASAICHRTHGGDVRECPVCGRIFRGIHPDVMIYSAEGKKSIGVDTVRLIRDQIYIYPNESDYKFFIIRDAELMTPAAQNALLISLEELPPFSVFILISDDRSSLIETVRSRCAAFRTECLDDGEIERSLMSIPEGVRAANADSTAFRAAIRAAGGSLGVAAELVFGKGTGDDEQAGNFAAELLKCVLTGSAADRVLYCASLPKSRDEVERILTLARLALRDVISFRYCTGAGNLFMCGGFDPGSLASVPIRKLLSFAAVLDDSLEALSANVSPALTMERAADCVL